MTVGEVDATFARLSATTGPGSQASRDALLGQLFDRATEDEARLLWGLLGGELRQGALEGVMIDALIRASKVPGAVLRRAVMLAGDLPGTARRALVDGVDALEAIGLEVLRPILPMLASPGSTVGEAIAAGGRSSVEWKLDGARIQAHRVGDEVRIYTRNLNEITDRLPGVVEIVRALPSEKLVLDGEVLGIDESGRPELFQDTMSSFSSDREPGVRRLVPYFFDVLHHDGHDLLDVPLDQRLATLAEITGRWRIPGEVTDSAARAGEILDEALAAGHEGVVVKQIDSTYQAGRRGSAWRKVKPVSTLDLVVLGAEWGHGRRHGWLSNLHLGARDPAGGFVMVGKTFKGMTDDLLRWQTEEFPKRAISDDGSTMLLRPELVVEIAVDGAQRSTRAAGGVSLRFARVKGYRPDKAAADADTIATVRSLADRGSGS